MLQKETRAVVQMEPEAIHITVWTTVLLYSAYVLITRLRLNLKAISKQDGINPVGRKLCLMRFIVRIQGQCCCRIM